MFVISGEKGGVRLKYLPGIPLFLGVFNRRWGIRGCCGVWMIILTRISLFWAVAPWEVVKIEAFVLSGGREESGLVFCQGSPCFLAFVPRFS